MTPDNSQASVQQPAPTRYIYKRFSVLKPGLPAGAKRKKTDYTTVSLYPSEFAKALRFAYGDPQLVSKAVRDVAETVAKTDLMPGDFSLIVRRKALARLRGQFRPGKAAEIATSVQAEAVLAAENNGAWATA